MNFILQYIDLLWLPIGVLTVHKQHRTWAAGFFIGCMIMMRLQAELMASTGFNSGFTGWWSMDAHSRGQITYSIFYVAYIALALYSPGTKGTIFMAASISIFFAALFTSMIVMVI
ncbi:MAG: hypothetical protein R3E13_07860 [Alphaproteobacteria bacterium]